MISRRLLSRFTVDQLREAIRLRAQLGQVEALEAKRDALLKKVAKIEKKLTKLNSKTSTKSKPGRRKGFKLSAATRRKMSEAAKRRYAGRGTAGTAKPARKRRSLSPKTRAKMAEAARRRWAKEKGQTALAGS